MDRNPLSFKQFTVNQAKLIKINFPEEKLFTLFHIYRKLSKNS